MKLICYNFNAMSVSRSGLVKRETGENPVRCRRCKRKQGSPFLTVVGRGRTEIAAQARRPAYCAFAATVYGDAGE